MAVAGQNTRRPPARPENYCESKQTYFSCSLDKAFHSPEFQAKLFFHAKLSVRFLLRQPLKPSTPFNLYQKLQQNVHRFLVP